MKSPFGCLSALALLFGVSAHAQGGMILQTELFGGHTYHLVADTGGARIEWDDAEAFALTLGGHLVTVDDAAENAFLLSTFGPTALTNSPPGGGLVSLWLGFNDAASEGAFVWASGAPVTYTNWASGEPAGTFAHEDFAGMIVSTGFRTPGQWHDIVSPFLFTDVTFGVVEVSAPAVPEPASLTLLGIGSLGLAGFARRRRKAV